MSFSSLVSVLTEKRRDKGAKSRSMYADLSNYPKSVKYYLKCPKCGLVHGDFKSMREAHAKRLCSACSLDSIDKLKDEIQKVVKDPAHKPKEIAKIVGESEEAESSAIPPEDLPSDDTFSRSWVDSAIDHFSLKEGYPLDAIELDDRWNHTYSYYNAHKTNLSMGVGLFVRTDNSYWLIFQNVSYAKLYAERLAEKEIYDHPAAFSAEWLSKYIDPKLILDYYGDANDEDNNMLQSLDYSGILSELTNRSVIPSTDLEFYDRDGEPLPETPARDKELWKILREFIKYRPKVDPLANMRNRFGTVKAEEEAIRHKLFDTEKASTDAVKAEGWEHFVAEYDGTSGVLEPDAVYCRTH